MKRAIAPLLALALGAIALPIAAQPVTIPGAANAASAAAVQASACIDTTAISPGKPFTLAVTLTNAQGYHLYYSNPGDAGLATSLKIDLPPGFKSEPLAFPIPFTFIQPGNITTFGYSGKTTFLFTITPPSSAAPPAAAHITASWLNCNKDQCTPGTAKLDVPLPTGAGQPANQELFTAARAALPDLSPPALLKDRVPIDFAYKLENPMTHQLGFTLEWNQRYSPSRVEAYPENIDGLHIDRIVVQPGGGNSFTRVSFHAYIMKGQKLPTSTLHVLIAYDKPDPNNPTGRGGRGGPAWFAGPNDPPGRRTGYILPIDLKPLIADSH